MPSESNPPITPDTTANVRYIVPMSLWFVEEVALPSDRMAVGHVVHMSVAIKDGDRCHLGPLYGRMLAQPGGRGQNQLQPE